jgi:hypothetical protein
MSMLELSTDEIDEIKRLKGLKDDEIISQKHFDDLRDIIVSKAKNKSSNQPTANAASEPAPTSSPVSGPCTPATNAPEHARANVTSSVNGEQRRPVSRTKACTPRGVPVAFTGNNKQKKEGMPLQRNLHSMFGPSTVTTTTGNTYQSVGGDQAAKKLLHCKVKGCTFAGTTHAPALHQHTVNAHPSEEGKTKGQLVLKDDGQGVCKIGQAELTARIVVHILVDAIVDQATKTVEDKRKEEKEACIRSKKGMDVEEKQSVDMRGMNKGKHHRHRYSFQQKAEVLQILERLEKDPSVSDKQAAAAKECDVSQSQISQWKKDEKRILQSATDATRKRLRCNYNANSRGLLWPNAEHQLMREFATRRRRGRRVSRLWLILRMRALIKQHYPDNTKKFTGSNGWLQRLSKRNRITPRKRSNKKCGSLEERLPALRNFIIGLAWLMRTPSKPAGDTLRNI